MKKDFIETEVQESDNNAAACDSYYEQLTERTPKKALYDAVQKGLYEKTHKGGSVIDFARKEEEPLSDEVHSVFEGCGIFMISRKRKMTRRSHKISSICL